MLSPVMTLSPLQYDQADEGKSPNGIKNIDDLAISRVCKDRF